MSRQRRVPDFAPPNPHGLYEVLCSYCLAAGRPAEMDRRRDGRFRHRDPDTTCEHVHEGEQPGGPLLWDIADPWEYQRIAGELGW